MLYLKLVQGMEVALHVKKMMKFKWHFSAVYLYYHQCLHTTTKALVGCAWKSTVHFLR